MKDGRKYNRMSVLAMMGFFCFFLSDILFFIIYLVVEELVTSHALADKEQEKKHYKSARMCSSYI